MLAEAASGAYALSWQRTRAAEARCRDAQDQEDRHLTLILVYFAAVTGYMADAAYWSSGPYRLLTAWQREI